MTAIFSNDDLATNAHLRHLFHSTTNCCYCLTFLGPLLVISLPVTSHVLDGVKVRRTGWPHQNIHSVSLLCGRTDRPHHPASGAYPCYTNCHVYGIKMHNISQFKFVLEFWLKKKERPYSLEDSICYTVCLQYA